MAFGDKKNRLTTPFIPDSKLVFTLPRGGKILEGKVILTGQIVVAGGTTSGAVQGEGGPINLVERIIVYANPAAGSRYAGGKVVDCTPRTLLRYAMLQHSGKFIGEQSGSTLGNGAAGTYNIYLSIPVYFAAPVLRNNLATALNADPTAYASIQVEVDTADLTACFTGNDRTVTWSGLQVQWADNRVGLDGDTNVLFQEDHTFLIAATQERAFDQAMPQDGAFLDWLILAEQSEADTLSDGLLARVTVDGSPITFDKYAQDIRQAMYDDEWLDPSQSGTGVYFIDFTDGSVGNSVIAASLQTQLKVINVSGANLDDLLISTRRVFAPAKSS